MMYSALKESNFNEIDRSAWNRPRAEILSLEKQLEKAISSGEIIDVEDKCPVRHFFVPKSEEYGCHTYGREIFMPAGVVVVGKIHRHSHLNFITSGKVLVATEFGKEEFTAPHTFVSEPGTKRAVLVLEDCLWTTVHLCKDTELENVEAEVIAPDYSDLDVVKLIEEVKK